MKRLRTLLPVTVFLACAPAGEGPSSTAGAHLASDLGQGGGGGGSGGGGGGGGSSSSPVGGCTVAQTGTAGVVIQGTLLLPSAPLVGEVFIDGTGKIACAAASCASTAGYASATILACPDDVISPGLINGHDHTEYATLGPVAHGTTRWDNRNGWRTGTGGEPMLQEPASTTSVPIIAARSCASCWAARPR